ncbi:MAG: MEDS domain-containing protein [Salinigranum sp.]
MPPHPSDERDILHRRNTLGLRDALAELDVHNHLALVYETQREQFDAAVPFIRMGLERNERCIYITDDNSAAEVIEAMRREGVTVDEALAEEALVVTDPTLSGPTSATATSSRIACSSSWPTRSNARKKRGTTRSARPAR